MSHPLAPPDRIAHLKSPYDRTLFLFHAIETVHAAVQSLSLLYKEIQSSLLALSVKIESLSIATPSTRPILPPSTRSRQVFLRGVPETSDGDDDDTYMEVVCEKIGFTSTVTHHRLPSKFPSPNSTRPLILTFDCPEDAGLFLRSLYAVKKTEESPLVARMNYATEELELYRSLWKEAIRLNDEAGARVATVRDLKLVRLEVQGTWKEIPRQSPTIITTLPMTPSKPTPVVRSTPKGGSISQYFIKPGQPGQ